MTEVEQLRQELSDIKTAFGHFACQVMAVAISGYADAAIVSNQLMDERHALAAVEKLAEVARELRSEKARGFYGNQKRDAAQPEVGTGGISSSLEG